MSERYNKPLRLAICKNCGNAVDTSEVLTVRMNGLKNSIGFNSLEVCDRIAECCPHPDYDYEV